MKVETSEDLTSGPWEPTADGICGRDLRMVELLADVGVTSSIQAVDGPAFLGEDQ